MRCLECRAEIAERAQVCARCGAWAPVEYQLYATEDRAAEAACDPPGGPAPAAIGASVGHQSPESVPDPDVGGAVLAEWVERRRFSDTRLRPGYDQQEVFAFLNAIRDSFLGVREPSLAPDEVRVKQFSTTRLRPGYDQGEVDAFLAEAEARLAAQLGARREAPADGPESGAADPVQIRCLECGAESDGIARVCARCGAPVAQQPSLTPEAAAGGSADSFMLPHELVSQQTGTASRRNVLLLVGVVAALTVGVLIVGLTSLRSSTRSEASTSVPSQLTVDQLQPGDCLRGSDMGLGTDSTWPDLVTAVPCTQQHIAEVFFAGNAWPQSLAAYPGDDAVNNTVHDLCDTAFAAYDGATSDESAFNNDPIAPDSSAWADGDRSVVCVAYKFTPQYPGGALVNYSIKGSNK